MLEFLLANHPLDCPVCDKGGECPLQDQAFSHGPGESRFIEEKRHFEKPIPISSLVYLDRERCILCDRCTRFAEDVAGDPLISFTSRGNTTQVQTFPDQPFASYFSGNTVQICPVGALTAKPYRFKARPWDLEQTESTCTTCSVGCRITVQSSQNQLLRYQGVDSDPVNWGWLCDKGRFAFEAVGLARAADRAAGPPGRRAGADQLGCGASTPRPVCSRPRSADGGPSSVAVIGGARGTNEDAYAWARLAREVVGTANVDAQLATGCDPTVLGIAPATIDDAAAATTIVLLGPDLKEELPVLYLRVRDAAEKRRTPPPRAQPEGHGADAVHVALRALRAGPAGRRRAVDAGRGRGGRAAGPRPGRRHRRSGQPGRAAGVDDAGAGRGPGRGARGQGPPGAAPRQRPRRPGGGAHPGRGWPGHGRDPRRGRRRAHRLPRPARRRPAVRLPRRRAGPTRRSTGRGRSSPSTPT